MVNCSWAHGFFWRGVRGGAKSLRVQTVQKLSLSDELQLLQHPARAGRGIISGGVGEAAWAAEGAAESLEEGHQLSDGGEWTQSEQWKVHTLCSGFTDHSIQLLKHKNTEDEEQGLYF